MATDTDLTASPIPGIPPVPVIRLSVPRYHEMARAGVFTPEERIELLDGWLVPKMTINPRHRLVTEKMRKHFDRLLPNGWHVTSHQPITLATSEPEPDVWIARGSLEDYPDRHPGAGDVALVVEVADTSLSQDRGLKKRIYAEAGIPVYWILNLVDNRLEVYSDPTGASQQPEYRKQETYAISEEVPVLLQGREVARLLVRDVLP